MTQLLSGAPVAEKIREKSRQESERLKSSGITPLLAVLRIGDKADTASYAASLEKNAPKSGVAIRRCELPGDISAEKAAAAIRELNEDPGVSGILLLRPLPPHLPEEELCGLIAPEKDVDCATDISLAGVFSGRELGFAPATPLAVMKMLDYYQIPLEGKKAVVLGRSLVVGRPLAMMLMERHATVTICHSRTGDISEYTRGADIVVAALGKPEALGAGALGEGQVIIDVGIHRKPDGHLCGDVDFAAVSEHAAAITPVPGGVGAVTTAVMLEQVVRAALRSKKQKK